MSIILSIAEFNIITGDLCCIPYGMFNNKEEAKLYAEAMIEKDKNEYIEEYGEEYVETNFIFDYTIKDINKMYNTGDTHTTEKWQEYLNKK